MSNALIVKMNEQEARSIIIIILLSLRFIILLLFNYMDILCCSHIV